MLYQAYSDELVGLRARPRKNRKFCTIVQIYLHWRMSADFSATCKRDTLQAQDGELHICFRDVHRNETSFEDVSAAWFHINWTGVDVWFLFRWGLPTMVTCPGQGTRPRPHATSVVCRSCWSTCLSWVSIFCFVLLVSVRWWSCIFLESPDLFFSSL